MFAHAGILLAAQAILDDLKVSSATSSMAHSISGKLQAGKGHLLFCLCCKCTANAMVARPHPATVRPQLVVHAAARCDSPLA